MELINLPFSVLFIQKLERRSNSRRQFSKILEAHDIVIIISSFLDTRSLINLISVDKNCHAIINIAMVQIRLLKQKIDRLQGIVKEPNRKPQKQQKLMPIQSGYRPIRVRTRKKQEKKEQKKIGPPIKIDDKQFEQMKAMQKKREILTSDIKKMFLETMESEWQQERGPQTVIDHMLDYVDPTGFKTKPTWKQKTSQDLKKLKRWIRRKSGILFFRDPDY